MKKLLLIFAFIPFVLQAQVVSSSVWFAPSESAGEYTEEYQALLDVWTVDPAGDTAIAQNALVYSLDTAGFWDRMDFLFVLANKNPQSALVDWIHPDSTATATNSPTFTVYEGYTGNGSNALVNTNRNLSTEGTNFTQNDACFGVYVRNNVAESKYVAGINNGSDNTYLYPRNTIDLVGYKINQDAGTTSVTAACSDSRGHWCVRRETVDYTEIYNNGESVTDVNKTSATVPNNDFLVLTHDNSTFCTYQVAIVYAMDNVSDAEAATLNTILETYMDAIGKGVQ